MEQKIIHFICYVDAGLDIENIPFASKLNDKILYNDMLLVCVIFLLQSKFRMYVLCETAGS